MLFLVGRDLDFGKGCLLQVQSLPIPTLKVFHLVLAQELVTTQLATYRPFMEGRAVSMSYMIS